MSDPVSKSWFCVFNHPEEHGYSGTPEEIVNRLMEEWISDSPTRTGAWIYCVSAEGLNHVHMVLEDEKAMRFSAIKRSYAIGMHFEPTKGDKLQAEDYINKRGKWEEKGEIILASVKFGEIKGRQGQRRDLDTIEELIRQGKTPNEIMSMSLNFARYENVIKKAYFLKIKNETPLKQDVCTYWHYGESGSGKSYSYIGLVEKYGRDKVYMVTDYENGFLDNYCSEPILFLDEFRGHLKFSTILTLLDGYTTEFHARYSNILKVWKEVHITSVKTLEPRFFDDEEVWKEVHITSVKTPYEIYQNLISDYAERKVDTYTQLKRRINYIVYHWKNNGNYYHYQLPMSQFHDRDTMEYMAKNNGFQPLPLDCVSLFEDKK